RLTKFSSADAATYSVVVSGVCGNPITNSANLVLNATTTASPLTGPTNNLGGSITFSTVAFGSGQLSCVWKKNGTIIPGQTANSLTVSNLTYADAGQYSVEVTGACGTATQSASLVVNHPPTVTILS